MSQAGSSEQYIYSETLNKEYIERIYQMSFSKSPDIRMPQIVSFFIEYLYGAL